MINGRFILDGQLERYCTWVDAEIGHERMVQRVHDARKALS